MKKAIFITALTLMVIIAAAGLFCIWGVNDYISKVPVITPKDGITCESGDTLALEDMFDLERKDGDTIKICGAAWTEEGGGRSAEISEDGQTVTFEGTGVCEISVFGAGSNHEGRNATVSITVKEASI